MSIEPEVKQRDVWFLSGIASLKTLLVVSAVGILLITNIASLVSDRLHNLMYSGLRNALLLAGANLAEAALRRSPTVRTEEKVKAKTASLAEENKNLTKGNQKLQVEAEELKNNNRKMQADADVLESKNQKLHAEADELKGKNQVLSAKNSAHVQEAAKNASKAKKLASTVSTRLARGVTRNIAAIPAEAVPYLGVSVTIGTTALDVYDACETVKEMNELLRMLGMPEENTGKVCGVAVPTKEQVFASLYRTWESSARDVTQAMTNLPLNVPIPAVRLPSTREVADSVCPVIKLPALCP
jgi:hypothetical protein